MAFLPIDRNIVNHWIYKDAEHLKVWVEMLFRARFLKESTIEVVDGQTVNVNQGEFIFGRISWSKRLGVSEGKIRSLLVKLTSENMITLERKTTKCSVYKLVNWDKYSLQNEGNNNQQNDQQNTTFNNQQNDQQSSLTQQGFEGIDNQQINQQKKNETTSRTTNEEECIKRNKDIKEYSYETLDLTNHLIDLMIINNPRAKVPVNKNKWNDDMDKLQRIDGYDYMELRTIIDWCQNDSFWKSNILSATKLRKQIGTLVIQMEEKNKQPRSYIGNQKQSKVNDNMNFFLGGYNNDRNGIESNSGKGIITLPESSS